MKIISINATTGEENLRDATEEELAQMGKDALIQAEQESFLVAKAAAKAAAEAKLAALGLTADDLKALGLGGN